MAQGQIDAALAELAGLEDDVDGRRDLLERAGFALLHRPALGGQLVARLCAMAEDAPELEHLSDLLGSALDAARLARENRKVRGDDFLQAVTDAVGLAAGQRRLGLAHRLLLARAWARNGLQAPAELELSAEELDQSGTAPAPQDRAAADAMLENLFKDLIRQAGGDALALHAALTETFPAMPPGMREHVVAWSVAKAEPIHAQMACLWLLDPAPPIRFAAARALAGRGAPGALSAEVAAKLVLLRSWMPEDEARRCVDQLLRDTLRTGFETGTQPAPWTVHSIMATLPDGGGAQSVGVALQSGNQRKVAMVLMKQGHGVKDAFAIPCTSATDQKSLMQRLSDETGAMKVPPAWLERALAMALADGLAAQLPPAPGLIEIAGLCGFSALRPEFVTTGALVAALPATTQLANLSAPARGKLINASEDWRDRHGIVQSWFEESDSAHDLLAAKRSPRALESALWKWLETRRDWWARIIARGADVLLAAGHPDADSFAATAMALLEGRDLKKIPIMADVHEQTIEAWIFDAPDIDQQTTIQELADLPAAPEPERKGELARLVKGAGVSADGIDGFLMGIILAPTMIAPNRWVPEILNSVMAALKPDTIQRFIDLIMMRATAAIEQARDNEVFVPVMAKRSKMAMRDWAGGFSHACDTFSSSWPAKSVGPDDRAMKVRISDAMALGFSAQDLRTLGQWIEARHARNVSAG